MMKDPKSAIIYNTIWSAKIDLVRQVWMHDVTNSLNQLLKNERQLYILNSELRTVHLYIGCWGTANIKGISGGPRYTIPIPVEAFNF